MSKIAAEMVRKMFETESKKQIERPVEDVEQHMKNMGLQIQDTQRRSEFLNKVKDFEDK